MKMSSQVILPNGISANYCLYDRQGRASAAKNQIWLTRIALSAPALARMICHMPTQQFQMTSQQLADERGNIILS